MLVYIAQGQWRGSGPGAPQGYRGPGKRWQQQHQHPPAYHYQAGAPVRPPPPPPPRQQQVQGPRPMYRQSPDGPRGQMPQRPVLQVQGQQQHVLQVPAGNVVQGPPAAVLQAQVVTTHQSVQGTALPQQVWLQVQPAPMQQLLVVQPVQQQPMLATQQPLVQRGGQLLVQLPKQNVATPVGMTGAVFLEPQQSPLQRFAVVSQQRGSQVPLHGVGLVTAGGAGGASVVGGSVLPAAAFSGPATVGDSTSSAAVAAAGARHEPSALEQPATVAPQRRSVFDRLGGHVVAAAAVSNAAAAAAAGNAAAAAESKRQKRQQQNIAARDRRRRRKAAAETAAAEAEAAEAAADAAEHAEDSGDGAFPRLSPDAIAALEKEHGYVWHSDTPYRESKWVVQECYRKVWYNQKEACCWQGPKEGEVDVDDGNRQWRLVQCKLCAYGAE